MRSLALVPLSLLYLWSCGSQESPSETPQSPSETPLGPSKATIPEPSQSPASDKVAEPTTTTPARSAPTAPVNDGGTTITCTPQPFAASIPIAEASGATLLKNGDLIVVGDSGTNGSFLTLDAQSGKVKQRGHLPLDSKSSDDLEGLARMDGRLYGITSSGWMREWVAKRSGYKLVTPSYALAKYDRRMLVCRSALDSNCAQNYEGLCLLPSAPSKGQCAGFAASKTKGTLMCLVQGKRGLRLDPTRSIAVARPKTLTGCHFDETGKLWFGTNFFAANSIGYVENWQSPEQATLTKLGPVGLGFDEALAVGSGGAVYRFSDTTSSPSLLGKYICR